jgi:hypothetical protein
MIKRPTAQQAAESSAVKQSVTAAEGTQADALKRKAIEEAKVKLPCPDAAKTPLTPNPYAGVQEASAYLNAQGVPRDARVQILQSFDVRTLQVRQAGGSEFGLRYFDGVNARAKGSYLFETFPASRASLALDPKWNGMINFTQWQVRPGATLLEGVASPQGVGLPGGQIQKFVPNLNDLLSP